MGDKVINTAVWSVEQQTGHVAQDKWPVRSSVSTHGLSWRKLVVKKIGLTDRMGLWDFGMEVAVVGAEQQTKS